MHFLCLDNFEGLVVNIFDKVAIREHFQNLCAKVGVECKEHFARAQTATQTKDWVVACSEWTSCRDIIVRSEGLLDRDDWLWLSGCHELVSANLWAFHSMNFGEALTAAIAAFKAWCQFQNMPKALDFQFHLLPTLWKMLYLWASTSDCEEEALDPDVRKFLINVLLQRRDYEVRTLKQQCKEFVVDESEFVIWEVQKLFFVYFKTEECLRWAREGSKLYQKRYTGKLDYVSKFNEAHMLWMLGACEEASKVFEKIRDNLDSKPWKTKSTDDHPAAWYCNPQYDYLVHLLQCGCYHHMAIQSGRGKKETDKLNELVNKEKDEYESLDMEFAAMFPHGDDLVREAFDYAAKNKWEEGYEKYFGPSRDQSKRVRMAASDFLNKLHTNYRNEYRQSYENGSPDESHFLNAQLCSMKLLKLNFHSLNPFDYSCIFIFINLVRLHHEKDRRVMFLKQSSNFDVKEKSPILQLNNVGKQTFLCLMSMFFIR